MAKKRLNRKVALIGSVVFVVAAFVVILAVLYFSRDPHKFIAEGDTALKLAQETTDPDQRKEIFRQVERKYGKAMGLAKTDELKVAILYRIAELYKSSEEWRKVLGCWTKIISLDKKDVPARYAMLKYLYIAAQSSPGSIWQDVSEQASEFIEIIEKPGADGELASMETSKLEIDELKQKQESAHRLGPYLYLIRGRANLETARLGLVTNREETLKQAVADLEKAQQSEPENTDAYLFLAQAATLRGDIETRKGDIDAEKTGRSEALAILKQGVDAAQDGVQANVNLLVTKYSFTKGDTEPNVQSRILAMEPEFVALENKFSSNPETFSAIASFYADYRLGYVYLDKAITAIDKAIKLDPNNVEYATLAATLYGKKYNIFNTKDDLNRANNIIRQALTLPDAQETTGPRSMVTRINQIRLHSMLILNHLGLILDSKMLVDEAEGQQMLTEAQQSVRKIEQLYGSGDDPQVIKWQGMAELAQARLNNEDPSAAIRKLYNTYTQLKASARSDASLSYILAKVFANSSESGAVGEFLSDAILHGIETLHPNARLDYSDLLIKATLWTWAVMGIDIFEQHCGVTDRSRILRIRANILARDFEEAQRNLEQIPHEDPNRMELTAAILTGKCRQIRYILEKRKEKPRAGIALQKILSQRTQQAEIEQRSTEQLTQDLKSHLSAFIESMDKLLPKDPNLVPNAMMTSLCEDAIATGHLDMATAITDKYLKYDPDNSTGLFYKRLLAEPEPANITDEKRKSIREEVITQIADPIRQTLTLGAFYQMNDEPDKAAEQFKKLAGVSGAKATLAADDSTHKRAAGYLFEIALDKKDWDLADSISQLAKHENMDDCSGDLYAARVALAKGQYETALAKIDSTLKQRPVFGYGYLFRARINALLGKEEAALADTRTAATINPLDKAITKDFAYQLYERNQRLGSSVSSAQLAEMKSALDWAIGLNPEDTRLMSFYAEYISDSDPERALALRQSLQENAPSIQNSLLLARMATRLAAEEAGKRRDALFQMAQTTLEQAKSIDPQNPAVLESYAEYYRQTGQSEKAEQMLAEQSLLLWRHFLRSGQYDEAKNVLEQSLEKNPKDVNTIKGLLLVAERASDKDAVKKYLDQLISVENTPDNHLSLVQTYLKMGLVSEGEQKLASFREKYPADGRGLFLAAWLSMRQGHLKEAMKMINKRLESDQSDSSAWLLRGNLNYMMADYQQAIMDLKQSKVLLDSPATRLLLARTYLRTGHREDAITELKPTAEDPQAPDEARLLLEEIYRRLGRKEQIEQFYTTMIEKLPDSVLWHIKAGGFAGETEDYETAEKEYQIALTKSEQRGRPNIEALGGYLKSLLLSKKFDKLFQDAGKYIDGNLATMAYYRMAEAKLKLGDRVSAVQYCTNAVQKAQTDENIPIQIQNMFYLVGDKEVEQLCNQKLQENPDSYTANLAMLTLCKLRGDYNKAIQYIDNCLKNAGENEPRQEKSLMQKAEIFILNFYKTSDNSNLKEAIKAYESLLEKKPNNTYVLNNISYILAENNLDLDKALEYAKRICEMRPDEPGYLDTYALALYKKGQFAEAMRVSQSALQQYQAQGILPPAVAYEHLGQSLEGIGELSQAHAAYEQALETGGKNLDKSTKERINASLERLGKNKSGETEQK
ncbi:MAG: hypothetical protein JW749_02715 [Sedimentisphaerales bacterium]|nr:hypothetical protein [Sedimentisphaerales bacterium]